MPNVDRIFGLKPVSHLLGLDWNGGVMPFYKAAGTSVTNDLFVGDPVTFSGTGGVDPVTGFYLPGIAIATAGAANAILGVITSIREQPNHLERANWIDGADVGIINVCVDKFVIYEGQADESVAITHLGKNLNLVATQAGNRTTGASGWEIDGTTDSSLATWQVKMIGYAQRPDNAAAADNNKLLVLINNHVLM
jgi:hypothetical protein